MKTTLGTGYFKKGQIIEVFGFHLKEVCFLSVIFYWIISSSYAQTSNTNTGSLTHGSINVSTEEIEALVDSLSIPQLKAEVLSSLKKKGLSTDLFTFYLDNKIQEDRIEFFKQINLGNISSSTIRSYIDIRKQVYINSYSDFLLVKDKLALQIAANSNLALEVNGPCTNIDFENGNTSGWQTSNADACRSATPCNANFTGASRLQVTNKSMTDPYIPGLSVVNPATGNYSVRMEDFVNGGNATIMRQTFQVTATNNVFTYHYAAVLEDPQENHNDNERPYFKVRMYDASGREIRCASYEAIAKPPINNFAHVSVPNPYAGMNNGAQILELYYRDWSTVSIPLLAYIGQNVTIEFSVSDCSRGAHLGYAYVDAECFQLTPSVPNTICGNQEVTITASAGFAAYSWSGPGIVGPSTNQTVKVNKAGDYTVKFTPFADNPCPVTLNVKVLEHCNPDPITASLCEDVSGSLTANDVNLANYASQITAFHTPPGTVVSWHKALPATNNNKITTPSKVTIKNGDKFYAIINYSVPGSDTAEIKFTVLSKPIVNFPSVASVCIGSSPFQISGATPSGGVFSGSNVSSAGSFNPTVAGTFKIKYTYTNSSGCIDSVSQNITVVPKPTVNAGPDQTICSNATSVSLKGSFTNSSGVVWSGGAGTYNPATSDITSYTPAASELNASSFTLTLTANGISPCAAVTDQIKIAVQPQPIVDAGPAQINCSTNPTFTLNGTTSNSVAGQWSGGKGTFTNANSATAAYTASQEEINAGTVTLTYSVANTNTSCPGSTDNVTLTIIKAPEIEAGPSQQLCASTTSIQLTAKSSNSSGNEWSGGLGSFASSTSLSTVYTPASSEISSGSITLKITAKGNAPCMAVTDNVSIVFVPLATVYAGAAQKLCSDTKSINLTGTASNYSAIKWTGGAGTYSSDASLQTVYTPTETEKQSGELVFTIKAKANTPCPEVSSTTKINFVPTPSADAGLPQTLCASVNSVFLNGTVTNSGAVKWSGGQGAFSSDNSSATTYTPSESEKISGAVTLKLTALPLSPCTAIDDEVKITFDPVPKVIIPADPTVCGNNAVTTLNASVSNASAAVWSGGKGTYAPSANSLSITYTPTQEEINVGKVPLTLTSIKNSSCDVASAIVTINITPPPVVEAGEPVVTCFNNPLVTLNGDVKGTTDYIWSTSGNGIFTPALNIQKPDYTLSNSELKNGTTTLTLTAFAPLCLPVSDQVIIKILPLPTPDLGPDRIECEGTAITISTLPVKGASYTWTKDDIQLPDNLNTISAISVSGVVKYVIEVTDKNLCRNQDTILFKGMPMPVVSVNDVATCDGTPVTLEAVIANYQDLVPYSPAFNWQKNGQTLITGTEQLSVTEGGTYTFTVNSSNCTASDNAVVSINPLPVIKLPASFTYCRDDETGVTIDAGPGFQYVWDSGFSTEQVVTISTPGVHTLTVTNQFNCSATTSTLVRDICPPRLFIGDAFSPDNDGVNDHYNVYGDHIGKFHMLIFNRWGEIIFESFDRLQPWNGIYKEELIPIGVYPWVITYEGDSEEYKGPYKMEGRVTVIR